VQTLGFLLILAKNTHLAVSSMIVHVFKCTAGVSSSLLGLYIT
jgi:hypothetical protein